MYQIPKKGTQVHDCDPLGLFVLINRAIKMNIFCMRKVKASNLSLRIQHLYESYFLLTKKPYLNNLGTFLKFLMTLEEF